MAHNTLYLTAAEQSLFDELNDELQDGWEVEVEDRKIEDTPEKRVMRMHLMHLRDPKLTVFRDKALAVRSTDELVTIIQQHDLGGVDEADLNEIFFAMGPVVLTALITYMLSHVSNDTDIDGVASLSVIRHLILNSIHSLDA